MKRNAFLITNISLILVLLVTCILVYIFRIASYDITIFTWANYLTANVYNSLDEEEDTKVKETVFPSLEAMMSKLHTTNYDVILTTDYMVSALIDEDVIKPIYSNSDSLTTKLASDIVDGSRFVDLWEHLSSIYPVNEDGATLYDYMVPYVWGDFKIIYNMKSPIIQDMFNNDSKYVGTYESIQYITDHGGTLAANSYPRDVISVGLKATGHSINDVTEESLEDAKEFLEVPFQSIKLQGNDLANTMADPGAWDVAYCFPGDSIGALLDNWIYSNPSGEPWYNFFSYYTPNVLVETSDHNYEELVAQGYVAGDRMPATIVWFDGFTISSNLSTSKQSEANKLINYATTSKVSLGSWLNESYAKDSGYELDSYSSFEKYYGGVKYTYYPSANKNVYESLTTDSNGSNGIDDQTIGQPISTSNNDVDSPISFNDGIGMTSSSFFDSYDASFSGNYINGTSDGEANWQGWYDQAPFQTKYSVACTTTNCPASYQTFNKDANHNVYGRTYVDGQWVDNVENDESYQYLYEQALMVDNTVWNSLMDLEDSTLLFNNPGGTEMMNYSYETQQLIVNLYNYLLTTT